MGEQLVFSLSRKIFFFFRAVFYETLGVGMAKLHFAR